MSEQPTAEATRPKGPAGKKYAGLTRNQWLITGGVFVAALVFIVWRHRKSAAAATQQAATNSGSNECTDANGKPVDCNQAFAQELADLANALDQAQAQGGGAGGSGVTGTVGTTPPDTVTGPPAVTQPPGTPVTSTGGTATKAPPAVAAPITGLHATHVTNTSFTVQWNPSAAPQGYAYGVRDLATHTDVTRGTTQNTSVTISGLRHKINYNFGIQGLPGGAGNNIHIRTT